MTPYFTKLGSEVLTRWKRKNFSLAAFPNLARQAVEENPPAEHLDLDQFIEEFLLQEDQPHQSSSGFGQPELIVFDSPKFYIQLLFWLDGTTQIHQHEFSGAFHVLRGSSIHSLFEFKNVLPVSAHLRAGDLALSKTQLLETGSTVPIVSGGACIHSLFHLETPSVTLVIRTHSDPGTGPQFTYLPPHLAIDPFQEDALTTRRLQLLDVLERTEDPAYPKLVLRMIEDLDFERGYFVLQNGTAYLQEIGQWETTLKAFRKKHGKLALYAAPTIAETAWRDRLVGLRSSVEEAEHRFFLALLLNLSRRADILAFVAKRFPGPPAKTVQRWAREFVCEDGAFLLDAELPLELAELGEEFPELLLTAFEFLFAGGKKPALLGALSEQQLELLRDCFRKSSLRALV